ncbi:outer membrane immunogenic protein [Labrys monachus]|uniref:Outer membrane immunogenic protein n=1 Tax=Labrys monachus TaxID=217067 RepID=A0ABU0FI88_9HYPH|nr:outer membrane immunogenic protein [Labrys monachus]
MAPIYVPFSWTGFYAGVNAGYGWNGADKIKDPTYYDTEHEYVGTFANGWFSGQRNSKRGSFTGGAQFGYNQQFGQFVVGIEADFNYLGQKTKYLADDITDIYEPIGDQNYNYHLREYLTPESKTEWFGTIRPRFGFTPVDRLLVYATGGLAYGQVKSSGNYNWHEYGYWWGGGGNADFDRSGGFSGSKSQVRWGWTIGAGAEYAITDHNTIKAEYLYVDLGKKNHVVVNPEDPGEFMTWKDSSRAHIVRVGLNYKF